MKKAKQYAVRLSALVMMMLSMSCATAGQEINCTFTPIYISKDDVLTIQTARQILEHNRKAQEFCGKVKEAK